MLDTCHVTNFTGKVCTQEPNFLEAKVNDHYLSRYKKTKGRRVVLGKQASEHSVKLMSNDFLALANHPKILQEQSITMLSQGHGALMSPIYLDDNDPQRALEKRFAFLLQKDDVALCQSGWGANFGLLKSITDPTTPVYLDRGAHSSLWEGVNASGAKGRPFKHNDVEHLESLINKYGAGVIVVDSLYSTDGSIAPLHELVELAENKNCVLVVDEAHSIGTYGPNGEGLVASMGLSDRVHFITASLAKAFAGRAGLVAGSMRNIEFFRGMAGPFLFSSKLLPHEITGFNVAIDVIKNESWRRERLAENTNYLRNSLTGLGYDVENGCSHIIALVAGSEENAIKLRDALESHDVFAALFCAPATPKNGCLVRMAVSAGLTQQELDKVIYACKGIKNEIDMSDWPLMKASQCSLKHAA